MNTWSPLQFDSFGSNDKDKDSYLSTLTAFLAANPPGSLGALPPASTLSLSSPEGSDSSSPSSSENQSASPHNLGQSINSLSSSSITTAPTRASAAAAAAAAANAGAGAPGDKRKSDKLNGALKDRRASSGDASDGIHTHGGSDEDDLDDDGNKTKGGKTSEKRRAQNRQAQRAFRERKEKHLKELEDRVFSLEQQTTDQGQENAALKQLLERLQSENERLKVYESAFSFTYAKDVSNSSSMPTSVQFGGADKPPTPPTSLDEIDFSLPPFSNPTLFTGTSASAATTSTTGAFATSPDAFSLSTLPATGSGLDHPLFFGSSLSAPSPASTAGDSTSGSSANVSTPPDLSADLFGAYRDPSSAGATGDYGLNSLNEFDSLFGGTAASLEDPSGVLAAYLAGSPSPPSALGAQKQQQQQQPQTFMPSPASMIGLSSTPASNAPSPGSCNSEKFTEKFTFDVDGLCSDLQAKAVCREAAKQALKQAMVEDARATEELYPSSS